LAARTPSLALVSCAQPCRAAAASNSQAPPLPLPDTRSHIYLCIGRDPAAQAQAGRRPRRRDHRLPHPALV
jgi:hypothetical protein